MAQKGFFRKLEYFQRLFATHGAKVTQEVAQPIPCFKVIEQRPDRDPCAFEYRRAPKDVLRTLDHGLFGLHGFCMTGYRGASKLSIGGSS